MATLDDWNQWFDRCAIDLCEPPERRKLQDFVAPRFKNQLRKYDSDFSMPGSKEAFHLLETDSLVSIHKKSEKRYKDWIKPDPERLTGDNLEQIDKAVNVRLRAIARKTASNEGHFRDKKHFDFWVSFDEPISSNTELSYDDLIPDRCSVEDEVELRECQAIAEGQARSLFTDLDEKSQALALAQGLELKISDPHFLQMLGVGQSAAYERWKKLTGRVEKHVAGSFESETDDTIRLLSRLSLRELGEVALAEAEKKREKDPENLLARILEAVEPDLNSGDPEEFETPH